MKLSIELTEAENTKLRAEAGRLGIEPEALVRAAVADLLSNEGEDFREAAEHALDELDAEEDPLSFHRIVRND